MRKNSVWYCMILPSLPARMSSLIRFQTGNDVLCTPTCITRPDSFQARYTSSASSIVWVIGFSQ